MPATPQPVVLTTSSIEGRDEEVVESNRSAVAYAVLTAGTAASRLAGGTGGGDVPAAILRIEALDGEFEELLEHENITALNAGWLRSQPYLLVLDDEEVGPYIQRLAALVPDLAERKAAGAQLYGSLERCETAGAHRRSGTLPAIRGAGKEISGRP